VTTSNRVPNRIVDSRHPIMPIQTKSQTSQPALLTLVAPVAVRPAKAQRLPGLDFTKGTLVLIMVLYHWVNYFIGPQWPYYKYLRFLTPSFLFITGFMISHVYLSKYAAADPRLSKRLFTRGLKLMAIFIALNVARNFVMPLLGTGQAMQNLPSLSNLQTVFVSGNLPVVGSKFVSFSILVPISYVLMLSAALMLPYRIYKYTFHITCAFLLLSILILGLAGGHSYNLEFIAIGMLGVLTGLMPIGMMSAFGRHPYALALAYLCYLILITLWNVPFPLLIVAVVLNLIVIYLLCGNGQGAVKNEVILLGKYSLLGYISQVAILQVLRAAFSRIDLGFSILPISFVAAFVLTIMSVEIVDRARSGAGTVDKLYKAVFA
jgi:peptidoglycan/LPS O-acetylase OafA/YrhL